MCAYRAFSRCAKCTQSTCKACSIKVLHHKMIVCLRGRHTIDAHNQSRPILRRSAPPRRRELRLPPQAALPNLRNLPPRSPCRSCHNPNNARMGSFCTFCVFDRPCGSPRRCRSPVGAQRPLSMHGHLDRPNVAPKSAFFKKKAPPENLWASAGSGRCPNV